MKTLFAPVIAVLGAIGYAYFTYTLMHDLQAEPEMTETIWQRSLIIYNGVASVGFSCIGYLIGTSIQMASLGAAKIDASQKTATIKQALNKLTSPVAGTPGDVGGGPQSEDHRVPEVRAILIGGLQ